MPEIPPRAQQSYTAKKRRRAMPAAGPVTIRRADGTVAIEPARKSGKIDRPHGHLRWDTS